MIRYSLQCDHSHEFEAWFKSSEDFDKQAARRLVSCPLCGSTNVSKAIMAPNISVGRSKEQEVRVANEAAMAEKRREFLALMRRLRAEVEKNAEYVGPRFAEEARKMHYDEVEKRGIYGEATLEEARELQEEGIEFFPLPRLPEDHN
ncbi:MAG: DUF1178 domain-containing protein [Proteobacteria bacterium]|jgi:hypothetical protein|nr:MAG: DUF1178 domain-containing protein [Pseudomonadota bacterium]